MGIIAFVVIANVVDVGMIIGTLLIIVIGAPTTDVVIMRVIVFS